MQQTLEIIFINNQNDLKFVFKFRKISKRCKNISEYWLAEILDDKYLKNVDVKQFKNLKKLSCSSKITDLDLLALPHLKHLELNANENITDQGIKHLQLTTLFLNRHKLDDNSKIPKIYGGPTNITDEGIRHMQLEVLDMCWHSNITSIGLRNSCSTLRILYAHKNNSITDDILQQMNLHTLDIGNNDKVTDAAIQHMTNLKVLNVSFMKGITNGALKHLNLEELRASEIHL